MLESIGISVFGDTTRKVTFEQSTEGCREARHVNWMKGIVFWAMKLKFSVGLSILI